MKIAKPIHAQSSIDPIAPKPHSMAQVAGAGAGDVDGSESRNDSSRAEERDQRCESKSMAAAIQFWLLSLPRRVS